MTLVKPQTVNLLDTIGTGYEAVNRRPWLLSIPMVMNLLLWLQGPLPLDSLWPGLSEGLASVIEEPGLRSRILAWLQSLDLRLAAVPFNFVPSLAPAMPGGAADPVLEPGLAIPGLVLCNGVALIISGCYLAGLAAAIRSDHAGPSILIGRGWRVAGVIGQAILAACGVGLVLSLPLIALTVLIVTMAPQLALPVLMGWYIMLFWLVIYLGLIPEAAAMGERGPLRTIYNSVNLVRRNLRATLILLALSLLIGSGLGTIFQRLAVEHGWWGLLLASLCSAYIGSGLAAARLAFYRERLARWTRC